MKRSDPLSTFFYRSASRNEPVREWLQTLTKEEKFRIGVDIWKAQSEWPIGMPHVRSLGKGLHEIRSRLPDGIARVLFMVDGNDLILLHGFIKKTQKTPREALALAEKRRADYDQAKKSNPRRGTSLSGLLKREGIFHAVVATAEKELLVGKLQSAMKEKMISASALAKAMETSRAHVKRILDPTNPSITLNTLGRAAHVMGKRWRFELVDV